MRRKYETEINVPKQEVFEMVGRASLFFARSYPKNDETLWWKIPEAFEQVIEEAYRRGFANGAGIKEVADE